MILMCSSFELGQGHNIYMHVECCKMSQWYFGGCPHLNNCLVSISMGQYFYHDAWSEQFVVLSNDVVVSSFLSYFLALLLAWCSNGLFSLEWALDKVGSHAISVAGFINGK